MGPLAGIWSGWLVWRFGSGQGFSDHLSMNIQVLIVLCVDNLDQCPDSNQPLVSDLLTVRHQELNCEKFFSSTIFLTGNVSGPTGTEVTITSPQIPQFNQSPDCQK